MMGADDRRLDAAVSLGIISAEQAEAIRALAPARPAVLPTSPATALGYLLGALTVLAAMGWFLADRWTWLGSGGVLAVVALYAVLFLVVARKLRGINQPTASGVLVLLAVLLTPLAVAAIGDMTDWFGHQGAACYGRDFVFWACRGEEVVMELATVAAALIALRFVRFPLLVAPIMAVVVRGLFHTSDLMHGMGGMRAVTSGWIWAVASGLLTAAAYLAERWQPEDEDYAQWLHLGTAICAGVTSILIIGQYDDRLWWLLVPGAFVALFLALRLRRLIWQLLGLAWFAAFLIWLANDVFNDTPAFPIVLAALGVGMIILTVWLQRNRERLVARFGTLDAEGRPTLPGGVALPLAFAVVAALQVPSAVALDEAIRAELDAAGRPRRAPRDTMPVEAKSRGVETSTPR